MSETRNMVTVQAFGPEMAGQRVGWWAMHNLVEDEEQYKRVNIATATVGEEGAALRYELVEEDGVQTKRWGWTDGVVGFSLAAGVSLLIEADTEPSEWMKDHRIAHEGHHYHDVESSFIMLKAAEGHNNNEVLEPLRRWRENPRDLMRDIRTTMAQEGLGDMYPAVYYTANLGMGHEFYRNDSKLRAVPMEALLLPNEEMLEDTRKQVALSENIVRSLVTQIENDQAMLRDLTAFGAVPAKQIPGAFQESRRRAAVCEKEAYEASEKLYTYSGVYLRVGSSGGRSWPYMDAGVADEGKAFGLELNALQQQNTMPAVTELEREQKELARRLAFARQGRAVLQKLVELESL